MMNRFQTLISNSTCAATARARAGRQMCGPGRLTTGPSGVWRRSCHPGGGRKSQGSITSMASMTSIASMTSMTKLRRIRKSGVVCVRCVSVSSSCQAAQGFQTNHFRVFQDPPTGSVFARSYLTSTSLSSFVFVLETCLHLGQAAGHGISIVQVQGMHNLGARMFAHYSLIIRTQLQRSGRTGDRNCVTIIDRRHVSL